MPPDEIINADQDQDQTDSTDQVDSPVEFQDELKQLKKGNKTLSEILNKQAEELKYLKSKLEPEQVVETQEEDLETRILKKTEEVVNRKQWYADNKARIENLSEESQAIFEEESKTLPLEKALKLAEYNEPYRVSTKEKLHASSSASVKRDTVQRASDAQKASGLSDEDIQKYGAKAQKVSVIL